MKYDLLPLVEAVKRLNGSNHIQDDSRLVKKDDIFILTSLNIKFSDQITLSSALPQLIIADHALYNMEKGLISDKFKLFHFIELTTAFSDINKLSSTGNYFFVLPKEISLKEYLADFLKIFYEIDNKVNIMAITGTNGKTSIAGFVAQMLTCLGYKAAAYGTIGLQIFFSLEKDEDLNDAFSLTTPSLCVLYHIIGTLYKKYQVNYFILEASSHGLAQDRLLGLSIKVAGISNLTHDHLDYHGTMEKYMESKGLLISKFLQPNGTMILNADDTYFSFFNKVCLQNNIKTLEYGEKAKDIQLLKILPSMQNCTQEVTIHYQGKTYSFIIHFIASFQVYNILCAMSYLLVLQIDIKDIIKIMPLIKAVEGRMEKIYNNHDIDIYIDYAHNPGAMETVLTETGKRYREREIIAVFGCGGNRDKTKRPIMGSIAAKYAHYVIITDDNPRNENPSIIREEIQQGAKIYASSPENVFNIPSREEAIKLALQMAKKFDAVILVLGKGHEKLQHSNDGSHDFNDRQIVEKILSTF